MKQVVWVVVLVLVASFCMAEQCGDMKEINQNCTMVTPTLSCAVYNYTVFNSTGGINETGNLSVFGNSSGFTTYYFNFTKSYGDFTVVLCDGSSREVTVIQGDKMILGALVLGAFLMCLVFIYISSSIDVKEHPTLKYFFLLFGIIFFFVPLWLCLLLVNQYYPGFAALSDALALIVQVYSYIIYCILAYILIYIFYMMYNRYVENRNKEFGYDER
jgi:hypothetical protein